MRHELHAARILGAIARDHTRMAIAASRWTTEQATPEAAALTARLHARAAAEAAESVFEWAVWPIEEDAAAIRRIADYAQDAANTADLAATAAEARANQTKGATA